MRKEVIKATAWGLAVTILLAFLIVLGSRRLAHFDAALVAYTASILFATFGLTYRYAMWLQRPPTAVYWRRGWETYGRMTDRDVQDAGLSRAQIERELARPFWRG